MSAWASVPTQARPLAFGGCTEPGGTLSVLLDAPCTPTCTHALDGASSRNSPPRSYNVAEPPVRPGAGAHRPGTARPGLPRSHPVLRRGLRAGGGFVHIRGSNVWTSLRERAMARSVR